MAAETHPSSSSSSDNHDYDVFLSFRGEDTRGNFTDHLYTALIQVGIRTFRDNEELIHGEEIGPILLKSIEQSRILIPIFSKNYASSKWCLQELTKMMECKNTCGQIVWPIFYKVEPSHVRNQTGCFKKAFLKHKKEQCEETVRAWRQALKEVANLKGWDSEDPEYRYETNLIDSVVDRALSELIRTNLQVAEHPTGIASHVKEVERMLDFESKDVQFVGIHGMGGIGKTTTAKAVFNNISYQFESSSFLADVRERASQCRGLVNLQNKLASNLLKGKNLDIDIVESGINVIKKQFCNKKVLIVLDDVDRDEQLCALAGGRDWFGPGSMIIITTRDEHIINVDQVDKSKIYKPNELDGNLSLQLFSKYAFGRDQPPQDFRELSKKVVAIVGGLPLALEVSGSFLRDKREYTDWEDTLKILKEIPHEEVQKRLKISYDGLNLDFKKLFLDIACFFIGMDKESVIPAWKACDYFSTIGIKVLVHKSLVKIDNDNKLRMHDQLRDMGREIVRQENPKKPGKRSRLWSHKEALEVLKQYKGTGKVEGLFLDFGYQEKNHDYYFDVGKFFTVCDHEAENYWTACEHEAENYWTVCDHEAEKLPQIDPPDLSTKAFEKMSDLRLLQVDGAYHDGNKFGHLPQGLKWLSLKRISCKCVPTISRLKKLAVLDLSGSDITDDWNGWQQIQSIETLKVLDLSRCCLLEDTPHFSCDTSLERLVLNYCINLVAVHESIGHLKKLVFLSLNCCYELTELPDSICKLSSIRSLILSYCFKLQKLPKELGNMESLTELIIDGTDIKEIPDSIGLLEKLERLSARNCGRLKKLPNLSNLKSLQALFLSDCKQLFEIQGISGLSLLQQLDLEDCRKLKLLHELPPGLIKLNMRYFTSMERLPNLSTLKNLKQLRLDNCYELAKIEGINGLTLLQELDLTNCKKLQSLPELPSSLIKLDARGCCSIERLPNLSNLKNLQAFNLCCTNLSKSHLSERQDISGLSVLQELDLEDCEMLQFLPRQPPSLSRLYIEGCLNLANIQGINDLTLLQELYLKSCSKLQSLSELPSSLTGIHVYDCDNLLEIQGISDLSLLQTLHLHSCRELQSLDLSNLKILKCLSLKDCYYLAEIQGLESLESLIEFQVCGCHTYVKTLQKSVSEGMLPTTAFNRGEICKSYPKIPDDDNIKGTIFYFVYQAEPWLINRDVFSIEVEIWRNDGKKTIRCVHDLRIREMNANADKYRLYSCYIQGLTWFGFPLKKRDIIHVMNAGFQFGVVELKMLDLVMEYEAMEDSQQLEKRVVRLITSRTKKRPREYDDADYQKQRI